jgi:hypothetical protein
LPSETQAYVIRITGRPADQWLSSEIRNDPASHIDAGEGAVRGGRRGRQGAGQDRARERLMSELAAATAHRSAPLPRKNMRKLQQRAVASAARLQSAGTADALATYNVACLCPHSLQVNGTRSWPARPRPDFSRRTCRRWPRSGCRPA